MDSEPPGGGTTHPTRVRAVYAALGDALGITTSPAAPRDGEDVESLSGRLRVAADLVDLLGEESISYVDVWADSPIKMRFASVKITVRHGDERKAIGAVHAAANLLSGDVTTRLNGPERMAVGFFADYQGVHVEVQTLVTPAALAASEARQADGTGR